MILKEKKNRYDVQLLCGHGAHITLKDNKISLQNDIDFFDQEK
jgi:hypothetical protein